MTEVIDFLLARRSVLAANLREPGPSDEQVEKILMAAARVPDHKKLVPWRFILFQGEARAKFGGILAEVCMERETDPTPTRIETEKGRFMRAPLVVAVVASPVEHPAVPEWEQTLSAGAACMSLANAASALGFSSQWITEWYAFDERIKDSLGLGTKEKVAGFIYIGTAAEKPTERDRPALDDIVTRWGE